MQQQSTITAQQVMQALGLRGKRQVQELAQQGRLERLLIPANPKEGRSRNLVSYSSESVEAEKARRATGIKMKGSLPASAIAAISAPSLASASADGWNKLSKFLDDWTARIDAEAKAKPALAEKIPDVPDDHFVTIAQAAKLKGMPQRWIREQIERGRLAFELTPRGAYRVLRGDLRAMPSSQRREMTRTQEKAA